MPSGQWSSQNDSPLQKDSPGWHWPPIQDNPLPHLTVTVHFTTLFHFEALSRKPISFRIGFRCSISEGESHSPLSYRELQTKLFQSNIGLDYLGIFGLWQFFGNSFGFRTWLLDFGFGFDHGKDWDWIFGFWIGLMDEIVAATMAEQPGPQIITEGGWLIVACFGLVDQLYLLLLTTCAVTCPMLKERGHINWNWSNSVRVPNIGRTWPY